MGQCSTGHNQQPDQLHYFEQRTGKKVNTSECVSVPVCVHAVVGWRPPWVVRGGDLCGLYSALSQDGKLVVEDIPLVVWGLCFGKVGGVIPCLFGPVRGYLRMGP